MDGEGDVTLRSVPCSQPQAHGIKRDEQHSLAAEVASRQKVQKVGESVKLNYNKPGREKRFT